ncbi:MAG: acetylxylan esterase, partial [Maribacter sp.]|nr:acetylxylan esterase [Maribacter sp.]
DPLISFSGEKINNAQDWAKERRPELLQFFEKKVYGKVPGKLDGFSVKVLEHSDQAINGKAKRKQVELTFERNSKKLSFTILIYTPKKVAKAPIFLGHNFYGNHTIGTDENVIISKAWARNNEAFGIEENKLSEKSRGVRSSRWAIEKIIDGGFGLATIYYGEVDPDKNDFSDGVHRLLYDKQQQEPNTGEWGSIAGWAWGLSRAMDYFSQDSEIDESQVIVFGHSRLGKASLWAGATDTRFAAVISNDSGCGGAALSKRRYGETIHVINKAFPHWFCRNFRSYNENEEALPVDQHQLLALIAPRPLYVASAQEDRWADPHGEFLSAHYATPVYTLFGKEGILSNKMPETNKPIQNTVSYHVRTGKHDVTDYDWEQYISWAKKFVIGPKK